MNAVEAARAALEAEGSDAAREIAGGREGRPMTDAANATIARGLLRDAYDHLVNGPKLDVIEVERLKKDARNLWWELCCLRDRVAKSGTPPKWLEDAEWAALEADVNLGRGVTAMRDEETAR